MANKKLRATAKLFLDTSSAQEDAKKFVSNLKQKLQDIESAADKMTVFKEMVDYIGQVDKALTALKNSNKETFDSMFSGLDSGLKRQLEGLFGTSMPQLEQVDILREKLATLTPKSSIKEIRGFAKEIETLFVSIGIDSPFDNIDAQFSGRGNAGHIELLTSSLSEFATVWSEVNNKVKNGFGFGGAGGGVPELDEGTKNKIAELENNIKKYKQIQEDLRSAYKDYDSFADGELVDLNFDASIEGAKQLIDTLKQAESTLKSTEKGTIEYYEALAKYSKLAVQIEPMRGALADNGINTRGIFKGYDSDLIISVFEDLDPDGLLMQDIKNTIKNVVVETQKEIERLKLGTSKIGFDESQGDKAIIVYDKLLEKLKEYHALSKKSNEEIDIDDDGENIADKIAQLDDYFDSLGKTKNEINKIQDVISRMSFDELTPSDAIKELSEFLEIKTDIGATNSVFVKITNGANEAANAVQNVMYHLGNLLNGKGKARDTFEDMIPNLTTVPTGTRYEQYGFGVLGGGLFGVTDPSTIDQKPGRNTFIQSVDLSKYNMYMANTEERATALIDFLSKLQKFSIKSAEPNYTGFDEQLNGVGTDVLYDQFKNVFEQSELTKGEFQSFIDEMINMLKQAGLEFDKQTNELGFTKLTDEVANSENISTRFLKKLGYQGVSVAGTSFDGLGQGSVLFDFDKVDIVGYFNSVKDAIEDYQKIVNSIDGSQWVGSTEQLKQYAINIEQIINKLTEYKTNSKSANTSEIDETLIKLTQIQKNIGDILAGKDIGSNNPFITITTGSGEAVRLIDQAKAKLQEFFNLTKEIKENVFSSGDATSNVEIGKYTERLETAKTALTKLGEAGALTEEELRQVNEAFENAYSHLSNETTHYDGYGSGYGDYSYSYYDEYQEQQERAESAEGENTRLQRQLETMRHLSNLDKQIGLTYDNNIDELDGLIEKRKTLLDMAENANSLSEEDLQTQRAITREYEEKAKFIHEGYDAAEKDLQKNLEYLSFENMGELSLEDIDGYINRLNIAYSKLEEAFRNNLMGDEDTFYENIERPYQRAITELEIEKERFQKENNYPQQKDVVDSNEVVQLESLQQKLLEVRQAVQNKTQAFRDEGMVVESVVNDEIQSLQKLKEYVESIEQAKRVDVIGSQIQDTKIVQADNGVIDTNQNTDTSKEINELDELKNKLLEVRQAIDAKTKAFVDEGMTVNQIVQQEIAALSVLFNALNEIRLAISDIWQSSIYQNTERQYLLEDGNRQIDNKQLLELPSTSDNGYALDTTLLTTNSILNNILSAVSNNESLSSFVEPLNNAVTALKNVSNGIIEEKKVKMIDTRDADARLADPKTVETIKTKALDTVSGRVVEGGTMDVTEMAAMANGMVKVSGYIQTATDKWEGFTLQVNKANEASKVTYSTNAKAAKQAENNAKKNADKTEEKNISEQDKFTQSLSTQKSAFSEYRKNLEGVSYISDKLLSDLDELGVKLQSVSDGDELTKWQSNFETIQDDVLTAKTVFEKIETDKLKTIRGSLNSEFKNLDFLFTSSNTTDEQRELIDLREQLITQIEKYKIAIKEGKSVELDSLNQTMDTLRQKINLYREQNNLSSSGKQKFGATATLNATAKYNSLKDQTTSGDFSDSSIVQQAFQQYEVAYNKLIAKRKEFSAIESELTDIQKSEFKQLQTECNDYAKTLSKIISDSKKLEANSVKKYTLAKDFDISSIDDRKKALNDSIEHLYGVNAKIGEFKNNFNQLLFTIDNGDGTFTNMTASINAAGTAIYATAGETEKATTAVGRYIEELKGKFRSISAYVISSFSIQEVIQQVRKGITYIKEIDSALVELKKVTDETDESYNKFLKDMSKTASVIGGTVANLTTMAAEWARLGYSMEEAGKLAESTAILLNVSEFNDATTASEALISTMQAFQYTANESQHVVDILNEVGKFIARR